MDIFYRKGTAEDTDKIFRMVSRAADNMEKQHIFQWDSDYPAKEDFKRDIEKNQLTIGLIGDSIAVVYTINKECEPEYKNGSWELPDCNFFVLHRLCVNPDFQNCGIARRTVEHIENTLREINAEALRLDVFSGNPYALRLYERLGYRRTGCADWTKGRFYLMEKPLQ